VDVAAHTNTPQGMLEDSWRSSMHDARKEGSFDWQQYHPRFRIVPELDQASRRMLYASGLLTSRAAPKEK
jgi:hypothetical protein